MLPNLEVYTPSIDIKSYDLADIKNIFTNANIKFNVIKKEDDHILTITDNHFNINCCFTFNSSNKLIAFNVEFN